MDSREGGERGLGRGETGSVYGCVYGEAAPGGF